MTTFDELRYDLDWLEMEEELYADDPGELRRVRIKIAEKVLELEDLARSEVATCPNK